MINLLSKPWRVYGRAAALVTVCMYVVGTAGHLLPATLPLMLAMTPWFLLALGLLVAAPAVAASGWRFVLWAAGTYAFTFAAEAAGVATGAIFGQYEYGPTLGWAWHGVPLVIAFNWVLVVHGSCGMAWRGPQAGVVARNRLATALCVGLMATTFDFVMEPVAMRLDYWRWPGDRVPLQNYAAWFVIAAAAAAGYPRDRSGSPAGRARRLAGLYVLVQAAFFLALRVGWHWTGG